MISGYLQKTWIYGSYLSHPAVGSDRNMAFSAIFLVCFDHSPKVFHKYPSKTSRYFWYPAKICEYLIEIWSIFSWYPFNRPLISGWYPNIRWTDSQQDVTSCVNTFLFLTEHEVVWCIKNVHFYYVIATIIVTMLLIKICISYITITLLFHTLNFSMLLYGPRYIRSVLFARLC